MHPHSSIDVVANFGFDDHCSCVHVDYQWRPSYLGLDERLDGCMRLALIVVVVHVRLRAEHRPCHKRVALTPRIVVRLMSSRLLDVRFAVLSRPLATLILNVHNSYIPLSYSRLFNMRLYPRTCLRHRQAMLRYLHDAASSLRTPQSIESNIKPPAAAGIMSGSHAEREAGRWLWRREVMGCLTCRWQERTLTAS